MPTELKGEALLDYYREAVRAWYDDGTAELAWLVCEHGWYRLSLPLRTPGGKLYEHIPFSEPAYRAAQVREMADELLRRAKEE